MLEKDVSIMTKTLRIYKAIQLSKLEILSNLDIRYYLSLDMEPLDMSTKLLIINIKKKWL
jgi:hypothetical protein